jgi:hypothetical protein
MNHILLLGEKSLCPELLLSVVHNSMQLAIFGHITSSRFLIEGFFSRRKGACKAAICIESLPREEFIESE